MKKFLSIFIMFVCCAFVFAGCGVVGSGDAAGIQFLQDVFYVDKNVETHLDYKVYPLTAKNYNIRYSLPANYGSDTTYRFVNGNVTVTDDAFRPIDIDINLNDAYTDTCTVRLRQYPKSIGIYKKNSENEDTKITNDSVYGGLVYALNVKGIFGSNSTPRFFEENEFNYQIESTNQNIIAIESERNLLVRSTGKRGSSLVTVRVCDGQGNAVSGLSTSINLTVVDPIDNTFATFDNRFVLRHGETYELTLEKGYEAVINVRSFNEEGFIINNAEYDCYLSNDSVFESRIDDLGIFLVVKGSGEVKVTLQSRSSDASGKPVKIEFVLKVQILGENNP